MSTIYTICFMFRVKDGIREVCLGEKRRGFRTGTLNGAGGKQQPGESLLACALRELLEEFRVKGLNIVKFGEILFYDPSLTHECHVFVIHEWEGDPQRSEEMDPAWYPVAAIPYELMGTADQHWMAPLLRGEKFRASFHYDANNQMFDPKIEVLPPEYSFE